MRADGSGEAEVLLNDAQPIDEGFYSHDEAWLVYRVGAGGDRDLYAIRPGVDSVGRPLVASDASEMAPALSPDGRWLAYVSDESGEPNVYVRPFPSADAQSRVSTNGGFGPVWARSGRELFYQNGANEMVVAEVLPGTTFTLGEEHVLFSTPYRRGYFHRAYDVAQDGQRFVMIRIADGRDSEQGTRNGVSGELIVVENFFEELKAKVGN